MLVKHIDFHFFDRAKYFFPNFVKIVLWASNSLQNSVHKIFVIKVQSPSCFNLPYDVIFSKQLKQPIIPFFLYDFNFPDKLHIRVYSNPQYWITVKLSSLKYIFCFKWEIFQFKFVHLELLDIALDHVFFLLTVTRSLIQRIKVFFSILQGSFNFTLKRYLCRNYWFKFFKSHFVLLWFDIATSTLYLIDHEIYLSCKESTSSLFLFYIKYVFACFQFILPLILI
jgi:hypothetical protein